MNRHHGLFRRLLRLFPADFRGDFGDEMADTFEAHRRDALSRGGAMAAARLWWDTVTGILRTAPREHWDLVRQDARYALRSLRRSPAFALATTAALAIGIGANTAVFSIVNAVLLTAVPFHDPARLVLLYERVPEAPSPFDFSAPDYEIARRAARSFEGMAAYRNAVYELSGIAQPERIPAARVSPGLFGVLGVAPTIGRALTEEDDRQNAHVAVLSHHLWSRLFGRDPSIVGRTVTLDRQPYTVVGVMPAGIDFPERGPETNHEPADVFVPIAFTPFERQGFGGMYNNTVVARLKPGVDVEGARAEMRTLARTIGDQYPPALAAIARELDLPLVPLTDAIVGPSRRLLLVLSGVVAVVLLIGCADVANLLLTRTAARQRELAVRSALGAAPARVVRQLLTEGAVLASAGGIAGLLLSLAATRAIVAAAGDALPRSGTIGLDARVAIFTAALSLATALVFGVVPALQSVLGSSLDALREGGRGASAGRARHRLLGLIVAGQFALALVLSVGAGLLVRSFVRLASTSPGFRPDQVAHVTTTLPAGRYTTGRQVKSFFEEAVAMARQAPGVSSAGAGNDLPLNVLERRTYSPDPSAVQLPPLERMTAATWTAGSYFEALGIPLRRGRYFTDADGASAQKVVIINEQLALRLWPHDDPVGHQIKWGLESAPSPWLTIVGVVGDAKQGPLGTATISQAYVPFLQLSDAAAADTITGLFRTVELVARSGGPAAVVLGGLRAGLRRMDPALPVTKAEALTDMVADSVRPQRFSMTLVGLFAAVALGLAALGIYGVLASAVGQQTREIGVRLALGAPPAAIVWTVLKRALALMAAGVAIGIPCALALTRVMAGLLYEVSPQDFATFAGSAVVLAALALAASLVPAWRATRVDPLTALRAE